MKTQTYNQI